MKTNTTIKTKPNARAEAISTALTINWEGVSEDDLRAMAQQALIVKYQANLRRAAEGETPTAIPTEATINAADFRVGTRAPKKSLADTVENLSKADRAALLEKLLALTAE